MTLESLSILLLCNFLVTPYGVTGFLLSNSECLVHPPCSCFHDDEGMESGIRCTDGDLTTIPKLGITFTSEFFDSFVISLENNHIRSVPGRVFANFSFVHSSSFSVNFYGNNISNIDTNAFAGVEDKITDLDIGNNDLAVLPPAVGKLNNLKSLSLDANPITSLDSVMMAHLGRSLTDFKIDMVHFTSWPSALNKLKTLQWLSIYFIPFNDLPLGALDGLDTLTGLVISYSKLEKIPSAICHARQLQDLFFEDNANVTRNVTMFGPCSPQMTNLTDIYFKNCSLYDFPDMLRSVPSLHYLNLDFNNISSIRPDVIPNGHALKTLIVTRNRLTSIPAAINKLTHLYTLSLSGNQITTVKNSDLKDLSSLVQLDLSENPIHSIAPESFKLNVQITYLNLKHVNLTLLPEAVRYISHLRHLSFRDNHADCSCGLSYLKGWDTSSVVIVGLCENLPQYSTIYRYISTSLQKCP